MDPTVQKRRALILDELSRHRTVRVAELSSKFGVSAVLIRRDLERLHEHGLLKRVHGGAVALPNGLGSAAAEPNGISYLDEKERIGRAAAGLVCPGDRLILDSGSTALQVACHIPGDLLTAGRLTAITVSVPIIEVLGPWKGIQLLILGGIYLPEYQVVVGPQTINAVKGLHADKMFLGADGMTFSHGLTTANVLEAEADRALVKAASQIIVVADSSKIGRIGLSTIMPLSEIHVLVTDTGAPEAFVSRLRDAGVQVLLV